MDWKPADPLFVEFETHTASVQDVEEMIARMRAVATEFGVDVSWFGTPQVIQRHLKKDPIDEQWDTPGIKPDELV